MGPASRLANQYRAPRRGRRHRLAETPDHRLRRDGDPPRKGEAARGPAAVGPAIETATRAVPAGRPEFGRLPPPTGPRGGTRLSGLTGRSPPASRPDRHQSWYRYAQTVVPSITTRTLWAGSMYASRLDPVGIGSPSGASLRHQCRNGRVQPCGQTVNFCSPAMRSSVSPRLTTNQSGPRPPVSASRTSTCAPRWQFCQPAVGGLPCHFTPKSCANSSRSRRSLRRSGQSRSSLLSGSSSHFAARSNHFFASAGLPER